MLLCLFSPFELVSEVSTKEGKALAASWGCPFVECSAKLNTGIQDIFLNLLNSIEVDSGLLLEEPEESCTIS